MAKTAKLKKNAKSSSIHSRAAKRASSPSIDIDKSLKNAKPPTEINPRPVLSVQHGAGVKKRKGRGKQMSRNKRMRLEKGSQRAEAVLDQLEKKVEKSLHKGKKFNGRRLAWDEVNERLGGKAPRKKSKKAEDGGDWEDEDDEELATDEAMPVDHATLEIADVVELTPKLAKSTLDEPEEEDEVL